MFQKITDRVEPPQKLKPTEDEHFQAVMTSREQGTWSRHDLTIAVNLARTLAKLDLANDQLDRDGLMIENNRGTMIPHPLLSATANMGNLIQSLSRTLGLSASQRGVAGASQDNRNKQEQEARSISEKANETDLLA